MSHAGIVHVIDDDEAVRDSIVFLLRSAGREVRTYASASEFMALGDGVEFGCVVSDVRMPGLSGIDLLKALNQRNPMPPVIVITGHADVALAVEAMKLGAVDFIEKPFEDDMLLDALDAAGRRLDTGAVERGALRATIRQRLTTLSEREQQVLDGLVAGHANKVIASDLGISPRTVEVYRANVMTKMDARSLSDLVRQALIVEDGS
jgi:two-component system, LuxR family, response regulator FixJ